MKKSELAMIRSIVMMVLLLASAGVRAQVISSGNITAHIDSIIALIPDAEPQGLYLQPSSATQTAWRSMIQDILAGDFASAHASASARSYQVVLYTDTYVHPGKTYVILERTPSATDRYWGTFVFDTAAVRDRLVIQCPHEGHDRNTGKQGFRVFTTAGARAYFLNGTHRCNGLTASPCDGATTACSETAQAYRYSDQCHVVAGTFQLTAEEMLDVYPDLIFIQPHGFTKESGDPDIIMSNGTTSTPAIDYLPTLRANLLAQDNSLTFKICHLDDWSRLLGSDNTQGRLINGSGSPCYDRAYTPSGRFIHLEQTYTKLRDTEANWRKLANAVAATFPVTGPIVTTKSGVWSDYSVWSGAAVPNDEDDITIMGGHSILVAGISPSCHDIDFAAANSYLEMEDNSRLTITGDFTINGSSHDVFAPGWSWLNSRLVFSGSDLQTLLGWSPGANATGFRNVLIDKSDGGLSTLGNGMKLVVSDSLEMLQGLFSVIGPDTLRIAGVLRLTDGVLDNSSAGAVVALADGGTIRRAHGTIQSQPMFGQNISVQYLNSLGPITAGPELPGNTTALNNLTLSGTGMVTLTADVTVNGTVSLETGGLATGAHTLMLGASATLQESSSAAVQGRVTAVRETVAGANCDFGGVGIEILAEGATPGITVATRVTGQAQILESGESAERYFDLTPTNNSGLGATLVFHYRDSELNGLSETSLSLYSSEDGGATWVSRGGTVEAQANTVTLEGIASLSRWTLGPATAGCCVGMVGDANGTGGDEPSLGDITTMIDALFISGSPAAIACLAEADVNRSASGEPAFVDVTITDISILIDYLFITGADLYDGGWGTGNLAPCP